MQNLRRHTDSQLDSQRAACEGTRIDLAAFLALDSDARAICWRQWDTAAKADVVIQQLNAKQLGWDNATVAAYIAKYDAKYAAGPVEAAVEGALERLALESSAAARQAETVADRAHFRRETTAYTNALVEYRRGVRPELLASGAWLLPSSQPGKPAHIVTMDGDWVCNCKAGQSMHWPIALVIGCDVALDDMERFDDPPESVLEVATRRTSETLEAMRAALGRRLCAAGRFDLRAA